MKTVAIVGTSGNTRALAPYDNPAVDIWMFNDQVLSDWAKRVNLIFKMHKPETFMATKSTYTEFLASNVSIPVYMQEKSQDVTASVKYPLEEITASLLPKFTRESDIIQYFTSSVCYAIALAIHQGYERIELYGVDMANNTEYIYQRDGIALWFGIALGRGIEVYIPRMCAMFNSPRYGYDDSTDSLTREYFEQIASELQPKIEECFGKLKASEGLVDGILGELEAIKANGEATQQKLDDIGGRYSDAMNVHHQAIADYASLTGQYQVCRQFQMRVEKQMEAAGRAQEVMALKEEWKPI